MTNTNFGRRICIRRHGTTKDNRGCEFEYTCYSMLLRFVDGRPIRNRYYRAQVAGQIIRAISLTDLKSQISALCPA